MDKLDVGKLKELKDKVDEESEILEYAVTAICGNYLEELDKYVEKVKNTIENIGDFELEKIVMMLPVLMYYAIEPLERLTMQAEYSKAMKKDIFNNYYLKAEGTIQDKTRFSELQTMNEELIEMAYERAFRKVKSKITTAEHIFSGAKKILTKRMQEYDIGKMELQYTQGKQFAERRD